MKLDRNNLFKNVTKNDLGYYELADSCRKVMNDFYENEYYQKDMSLYHKTEYTEDEIIHRNNLYKEKECMFGKLGGGARYPIGCWMRRRSCLGILFKQWMAGDRNRF